MELNHDLHHYYDCSLNREEWLSSVQLQMFQAFPSQITGIACAQVSILNPDVRARRLFKVGFEVVEKWTGRMLYDQFPGSRGVGRVLAFDPATSPLGLLLLHELLALLSPSFVDGVAWVVDLEGVLVVHVGILDFSGLLIKLQNVGHPKSDGERWREFKDEWIL